MKKTKSLQLLTLTFLASLSLKDEGRAVSCPNHISFQQVETMRREGHVEMGGEVLSIESAGIIPPEGLRAPPGGLEGEPAPHAGAGAYRCRYGVANFIVRTPAVWTEFQRQRAEERAAGYAAAHSRPGGHMLHSQHVQQMHHMGAAQQVHHMGAAQQVHHMGPAQHMLNSRPAGNENHSR